MADELKNTGKGKSGEVRSDGADGIACWFIDTDYNEESFFVPRTNVRAVNSSRRC